VDESKSSDKESIPENGDTQAETEGDNNRDCMCIGNETRGAAQGGAAWAGGA
jgi:hypothetical protein